MIEEGNHETTVRRLIAGFSTGVLTLALGAAVAPASQADDEYKVLVVGKTLGFRHSSIDVGTATVIELGQENHPYSWCHNYDGGRSWYTALGHRESTFADPLFREHLLGGIEWTAGVAGGGGDCVTFYEVGNLVDGLRDAGGVLNDVAAKNITKHLDRAESAADADDHGLALDELHVAQVLAGALVKDDETSAVLAGKIDDLMDWQQGLADA